MLVLQIFLLFLLFTKLKLRKDVLKKILSAIQRFDNYNYLCQVFFFCFVLIFISYYTKVEKVTVTGGKFCLLGVSKSWLGGLGVRSDPISKGIFSSVSVCNELLQSLRTLKRNIASPLYTNLQAANFPRCESCGLVHMSGIHWHRCASPTSGFAFVYFTAQYYIEHSSTVSLFQAQDVRKQASVM